MDSRTCCGVARATSVSGHCQKRFTRCQSVALLEDLRHGVRGAGWKVGAATSAHVLWSGAEDEGFFGVWEVTVVTRILSCDERWPLPAGAVDGRPPVAFGAPAASDRARRALRMSL